MRITKDKSEDSMNLREQAEKRAKQPIVEFRKQRGEDTAELIHELRVHQIELEIQNEELRNAQLELADSRNKYCELYDFAPVGYFTLNKEGLIVGANLTGAAFLGEERGNLLKSKFSHFITPGSQDDFYLHHKQVVESGTRQSCEVKLRRKDGAEFPAQLVSVAVAEQKDDYDQFRMTITDITEQKQAEDKLEQERNLLRTMIDHIPGEVYVKDKESRFILCNKIVAESRKRDANDNIIGKTDFDLFEHEIAQQFFDEEQYLMQTGRSLINSEGRFINKTGEVFYCSINKVPLRDIAGNITGLVGINYDVTERKQAEQKILEYQKYLKRLAARLTLAEEGERRRIAGAIHDEISQTLAMAKIKLDAIRSSPPSEWSSVEIKQISSCIAKVIQETRTLTFELSNPILYELGFEAAAAEWLNEHVQIKHGIATEFIDDGNDKPLDDNVKVVLFRNVRELLTNCIKHAKAKTIRANIRRIDNSIEVIVEDNGAGFDPVQVRATAFKKAKFGLFSVRESLENIGGSFEIESKPGAGCRATMVAPMKNTQTNKEM
jgi:PAS domain S-box-containing protein